jgi:hypothetical protein
MAQVGVVALAQLEILLLLTLEVAAQEQHLLFQAHQLHTPVAAVAALLPMEQQQRLEEQVGVVLVVLMEQLEATALPTQAAVVAVLVAI